ncbi:hypothetical protein RvY_05241-2 [Ramazzottius varieornatus]|uniref:Uncharacterized protein n=1 Tax=Ramazzottius varieornatus TaxID=947166 RepID=A0A1D1UY21_RAMVA|nr:hypothetical protein RvY_05241-2 [Ramazzottius varieornatus]
MEQTGSSHSDPMTLRLEATSCYERGDYAGCLEYLKQLLRDYSDISPEHRLAMGNCFFKLGNLTKAALAYQRTLQLDTSSEGARVGLAAIKFLQGHTEESLASFYALLSSGGSDTCMQLGFLCDDLCAAEDIEAVCELADVVFSCRQPNQLKGRIAYRVGRRFHDQNEFSSAAVYYEAAVHWMGDHNSLALFGLGQAHIYKNQFQKAVCCFQQLLATHPENADVLRLLGFTHFRLNSTAEARRSLEEFLRASPGDGDVLLVLAQVCERDDQPRALKYSLELLGKYEKSKISPPVELLNNISTLYFVLRDFHNSRKFSDLAFGAMIQANGECRASEATLLYNSARIYEALGELEAAGDEYAIVLQEHPHYIDACVRLAQLEFRAGNSVRARAFLDSALGMNPSNSSLLVLKGDFLMAEKKLEEAHDNYEQALRSGPDARNDIFTMLKFGNACLELFHGENSPTVKNEWAQTAYTTFRKVLEIDPTTPYAVNGMGVILANNGDVGLEMFKLVQETSPAYADAWLNAGNVFSTRKDFEKAVEMYSQAVQIEPENPVFVALMSRAQFNLANVLKTAAVATLRKGQTGTVISVDELSQAIKDLESAQVFFQSLSLSDRPDRAKSADRALRESNVCSEILKRSVPQMERALEVSVQETKVTKAAVGLVEGVAEQTSPRVGKRTATQISGTGKGKMARQSVQAKEFLEKRSRKYAQLEDLPNDPAPKVMGAPQREPQRKRAKAVVGDEIERRRRKIAERKRREQEIEKIMLSSEDECVTARKRPARRKPLDLTAIQIRRRPPAGQKSSHAEDASSSAVYASESENYPPLSLSISSAGSAEHVPVNPPEEAKNPEMIPVKQLTKTNSDESHPEAVFAVPLVPKRHFSDGDDVIPTTKATASSSLSPSQQLSQASTREEKSKIMKAEPDEIVKRSNCCSESESRKRRGSAHVVSSSESTCA